MKSLSDLDDLDSYRHLFTDVDFWTPYVRQVCERHGLSGARIRTGVPGTCPVFIVADSAGVDRWVVKFFGRLFDGAQGFAAEREAGRLSALDPEIRTAKMVAAGQLHAAGPLHARDISLASREDEDDAGDWPWPYLIFEYIEGVSIGEVMEQVSLQDRLRAARELGDTVRRIHALPLRGSPVFPDSWVPYLRFLEQQRAGVVERQRVWGSLPPCLLTGIDEFIPTPEELVGRTREPHLIHADLTRDHLLGRLENGRWTSLAIIDFGDAMTGGLLYELCALHLDLFGGDKRLLAAFLEAYGYAAGISALSPRGALATALLHRFNVFAAVPEAVLQVETLEELAERLYGV